jgi:hypothetical protein
MQMTQNIGEAKENIFDLFGQPFYAGKIYVGLFFTK